VSARQLSTPREVLSTAVPVDLAAELRDRARAEDRNLSNYIARLLAAALEGDDV
jgi:hypothetical protein